MSVKTRIQDVTDSINRLIDYANGTTGASDTRIGDAIKTLANGYGGGGVQVYTDTVTPNNTSSFEIPTPFEPYFFMAKAKNDADLIGVNCIFYWCKQRYKYPDRNNSQTGGAICRKSADSSAGQTVVESTANQFVLFKQNSVVIKTNNANYPVINAPIDFVVFGNI